jgi:carbon-monoxide dehydrogenase medium subunit
VIPKVKARQITGPEILMDLKGIPGLDYIDYDEKAGLRIGALASIFSVAHSSVVQEHYPMLAQGANSIASTQVQNRGTIAGNICSAVPSADSAPALLCLDARLICVSAKGERTIPINGFFKGPGQTDLGPGELLKEIRIRPQEERSQGMYIKLSPRTRMDLAVVGVAVKGAVDNGSFRDVAIGLGAVAPKPMRAGKAEELMNGAKAGPEIIEEAARSSALEAKPIDDHRASSEYRKMMVEVLVKRAIHEAFLN